jgi:hypothetical protein
MILILDKRSEQSCFLVSQKIIPYLFGRLVFNILKRVRKTFLLLTKENLGLSYKGCVKDV